jgi:hypothetical protein
MLIDLHQGRFFWPGVGRNGVSKPACRHPEKSLIVRRELRACVGVRFRPVKEIPDSLALVGRNRRDIYQSLYTWIVCSGSRDDSPA